MELKRKRFQGVLNILSFNRHFYVIGLLVLVIIIISNVIFSWPTLLFWLVITAFIYGLTMPLIISAYVYDLSRYYDFEWLNNINIEDRSDAHILNINAGFDETSYIISNRFPKSNLKVFDFYDGKRHTEPAIVRARKVSLAYPNTEALIANKIPVNDKSIDVIFLLSAIHEIRSDDEKVEFLKECHRVCKPTAKVIMVEHLRDFPNFMAFSVGFTHFFSRKVWKIVFSKAGFTSFEESKFTPFMSIFTAKP